MKEVQSPKKVDVTVSVCLSKTFTIEVDDYELLEKGKDEDGIPFEDIYFGDCDLESAVCNQHWLPQDVLKNISKLRECSPTLAEDCKNWNIDEFNVELE